MPGGPKNSRNGPRAGAQKSGVRERAFQLVRETGIPQSLAQQVALGNLSLNEVLERMATRDKVDGLMKKHELPKSLATQIALGQAELDVVLRKKRLASHVEDNRARSIFAEVAGTNTVVHLGLHGRKTVQCTITAIDRYEVVLVPVGGVEERIHKLQVKYACLDSDAKLVRNQIKRDKERNQDAEPVWKPQDRYGCSDRRLFGLLDEQVATSVTLLEGEVFVGQVEWMGRWEFGMMLKKKNARVVIFRHALADVRRA